MNHLEENAEISSEEITPPLEPITSKILQNPYEIHNFRKAYQSVLEEMQVGQIKSKGRIAFGKVTDSSSIEPNYLYLKFSPQDSIQESVLKTHEEIIFLDYPFEYEEPEAYRASVTLEEGELLDYWCAVPIATELPNVSYEVLQEMYIPEDDESAEAEMAKEEGGFRQTSRGVINSSIDFINHVVERAYTQTDNQDLLPDLPEGVDLKDKNNQPPRFLGINFRSKWRPTGTIKIWDEIIGSTEESRLECVDVAKVDYSPCHRGDYANCPRYYTERECETVVTGTVAGSYLPLEGAQVLFRDTWTLARAITDRHGNYRCDQEIRAKAKHVIQWERYHFSIRDNTGIFQAEDAGPKLHNQPWHHNIKGGREEYRGHIFRGAHFYYYGDLAGVKYRPQANNFLTTQLKISAREKNSSDAWFPSSANMFIGDDTFGLFSHIRIKEYDESSEDIFGTTIHELAHAAHYDVWPPTYSYLINHAYIYNFDADTPNYKGRSTRRLIESYAVAMEIYLTNTYYRRFIGLGYSYKNDLQGKTTDEGEGRYYTTAIFDLNDDYNQNLKRSSLLAPDEVSNIPWSEIEEALRFTKGWDDFRDKIIQVHGAQENEIRALFNHFEK